MFLLLVEDIIEEVQVVVEEKSGEDLSEGELDEDLSERVMFELRLDDEEPSLQRSLKRMV